MDAFDWKPRVFDGFLKMYFVRLAFLVCPLEYLLDLSGHINEVDFKKEINTLGPALKGLFNKKTQKYFLFIYLFLEIPIFPGRKTIRPVSQFFYGSDSLGK